MRFANVISLLALFIALGGTSYAVTQIDDNSVSARHVVNSSLTGSDIKTGSVYSSDVKDGSLTAADVLGGLPGITYFKFNGAEFPMPTAQTTPIITDTVAAGDYFVTAQVIADGIKAQRGDIICRVHYGAGTDPPAAAYGYDTRVFASDTIDGLPPAMSITLSGVFVAKTDNTPVVLKCKGLGLKHTNSRLMSIELRDLQIESQG